MSFKTLILALLLGTVSCATTPSDKPLPTPIGTWRIVRFSRHDIETGQDTNIKGESPTGYLIYTAGGHVVVWLAGDNRTPQVGAVAQDRERLAWFNETISGYSGTYSVACTLAAGMTLRCLVITRASSPRANWAWRA